MRLVATGKCKKTLSNYLEKTDNLRTVMAMMHTIVTSDTSLYS